MADYRLTNSILYIFQTIIKSLFPLLLIPIITNLLSTSDYGVFILLQVYVLFVLGVLNLGLFTGFERDFFEYETKTKGFYTLFHSLFIFSCLILIFFNGVVFFFKNEIANLIVSDLNYGFLLILILIGESLLNLTQYYSIFLKNSTQAKNFSIFSISRSASYFLFSVFFLIILDLGLIGLGYSVFFTGILMFTWAIFMQFRRFNFAFKLSVVINMLRATYKLTPRVFFGYLHTNFDKIMIGILLSNSAVGIYSIGQKISYIIFQFMTALDHMLIPEIYSGLFSQKKDKLKELAEVITICFYVSTLFSLLVALFSEYLISYLLPDSYSNSSQIVIILSIFYTILFFGKISGTQLIHSKSYLTISILTLIGMLINIMFNIPLIIYWGIIGAALATTLAGLINTIMSFIIAQKNSPIDLEWSSIMSIFVFFLISVLFVIILNFFFEASVITVFSIKAILVVLFLILGLLKGILKGSKIIQLFNLNKILLK